MASDTETLNLSEILNDHLDNTGQYDFDSGWYTIFIRDAVYVLPIGDSADHYSGECACDPARSWYFNEPPIVTHNAFDRREVNE